MKIIVDTEVFWAFLAEPDTLTSATLGILDKAAEQRELYVSVASILQFREGLRIGTVTRDQVERLESWARGDHARLLPIDMRVVASMSHRHAADSLVDQLIRGTARVENCRLATFRELDDPDLDVVVCARKPADVRG